MSPDELRSLAQEERVPIDLAFYKARDEALNPVFRRDLVEEAFRELSRCINSEFRRASLASQLALLCAELGEALDRVIGHVEASFPAGTKVDPVFRDARAVLASLEALEKP